MSAPDLSHGGVGQPATHAFAITPGADDLAAMTRAIYVGGAGNIQAVMFGGETVVFTAVPVGTILPIRATKILSGSTTATLLIGLY